MLEPVGLVVVSNHAATARPPGPIATDQFCDQPEPISVEAVHPRLGSKRAVRTGALMPELGV